MWKINKDFIEHDGAMMTVDIKSRDFDADEFEAAEKTHFKMYDCDGILYYSGYHAELGGETDCLFSPLDDYGMPNAGCTDISYRNAKTGHYETL